MKKRLEIVNIIKNKTKMYEYLGYKMLNEGRYSLLQQILQGKIDERSSDKKYFVVKKLTNNGIIPGSCQTFLIVRMIANIGNEFARGEEKILSIVVSISCIC